MQQKRGFTLIELLVVVAIIIALLAILLPSMNQAVTVAVSTQCLSQQRQVSQAALNHGADHFGELPAQHASGILWLTAETHDAFEQYLSGVGAVFHCPTLEQADWGLTAAIIGAANVDQPAQWYWDNPTTYSGGLYLIGTFYLGNPTAGASPDALWADTLGRIGPQDDYVLRVGGDHNPDAAVVADGMLRHASGNLDDWILRHPGGTNEGWTNHALIDGSAKSRPRSEILVRHGYNNGLTSPAGW